ncbi:hypothetical protein FKW77_008265 [Venturia effusa]|uniref:Histone deacetylase domain-containing protein n=1 Tax=Venturia effusa TaxID=50376 RepID=A0A517L1S3_9PEZI|nr:hypothetical protein FKW77_008265 [Venturia effusa]
MSSSKKPPGANNTNNDVNSSPSHAVALSQSLHRLSINDMQRAGSLPPSPARSPRAELFRTLSSPRPSPTLRRASSSMSLDRRSTSPATLLRKTSTSSLRGDSMSLGNRRPSSHHTSSPLAPSIEEPIMTANTVAEAHFKQELECHATSEASVNTVVILHDACYGHRFARPKTNKGMLGLIMERPERIQASVMGISAAYVRLGERHEGGQHEPDPRRQLPRSLPFKIRKTSRTMPLNSPAVTRVHGTKWMDELKFMCDTAGQKLATTGRETERPPDPSQKNRPPLHSGDLYLSPESLAAFEGALGGVCEAVDTVFEGTASGHGPSQAFVCVRPPGHHCSSDLPSGFCWLNNVHVGIQHAVIEHGLTHAAIIDFDLHHGDGSQSIAWDHNEKVLNMPKNKPNSSKTSIGYFSIHDINSYPCENGESSKIQNASLCIENAHNQSIWNVHLDPWKDEAEFWELYEHKYLAIISKARSFLRHHTTRLLAATGANHPRPRAAIFISAGFDASEHETPNMQRHAVNVPTDFYARFTRDIVALANEEGTSVDGRVISVLEGGYSDKALISGVLSHVSGLCHGHNVSASPGQEDDLVSQMANMNMGLSGLPITGPSRDSTIPSPLRYNSEWWLSENLDALVRLLNPSAVPEAIVPKKPRTGAYSSPTHASTMKVVDPTQLRRVASGSLRFGTSSISPSRPPTPPPPSVDWATASHELSKLLIPTDGRSTTSHTAAELAQPKVKKERHSTIGLAAVPSAQGGRQLRERSKAPAVDVGRGKAAPIDSDRRKTIAVTETPIATRDDRLAAAAVQRRRSSIGSQATMSSASTISARPTVGVPMKKQRASKAPPSISESRKTSSGASSLQNLTQRFQQAKISSATSDVLKTNGNANVAKVTTTGTQRLKINVPSDTEYASRQQKPVTATRKPPVVKASKSVAPKKAATKAKVSSPGSADNFSKTEMTPPSTLTAENHLATPPQAAPPQQEANRADAPDSITSSGFSHDPLSFKSQPEIVLQTQDLTWTTPYAGPPSNFKPSPTAGETSPTASRAPTDPKPPVFTSTGHIPFSPVKPAPPPGGSGN